MHVEAMQGQRCAYCEGRTTTDHRHLEHFEQKSRNPPMTFSWQNLFGSCNREETCGRHKDRLARYDAADLIKPDVEDPEKFLIFIARTGKVEVREGLAGQDRHRALETIRIFNLNGGALPELRRAAARQYLPDAEQAQNYFNAGDWTIEDCLYFFQAELAATAVQPFATAIRHALLPS